MAHRSTKFDYAGPLLKYGLSSARLSTTARPPRDELKETAVDERALGRILIAVGDKFIPASLNGVALWTAIKKAAQDKDTFDRFRSGPRTRAIIKAMNGIRKAADALMSVVKENADAAQLMANTVSDPLMIIQQVIDCSVYYERTLTSSNNDLREKYDRIPSPTEWLVGVELPNIFEEFFAREARRSHNNGKPSGPTVRFIVAVMNEVACPCRPGTIIRAMTRYSKLRNLRKTATRLEFLERRLRLLQHEERQLRAARDA